MPPLTPGTNKKLTEVLNASFASWEKEVQSYKITKGEFMLCLSDSKCNLINAHAQCFDANNRNVKRTFHLLADGANSSFFTFLHSAAERDDKWFTAGVH